MGMRTQRRRERSKTPQRRAYRLLGSNMRIWSVIILATLTLTLGYHIVDLFVHPSLWNTIVVFGVIGFTAFVVFTNNKWSNSKRKRRRSRNGEWIK